MLSLAQIKHVSWDQMGAIDLLIDLEKERTWDGTMTQRIYVKQRPWVAPIIPVVFKSIEEFLGQRFVSWEVGWK